LKIAIKGFKRKNKECTAIVLRCYRATERKFKDRKPTKHAGYMTLHPGVSVAGERAELVPGIWKEIRNYREEIVKMARAVMYDKNYIQLDLIFDRLAELGDIQSPPSWYLQWKELVRQHVTGATEYSVKGREDDNSDPYFGTYGDLKIDPNWGG
jgi:hypothetical protein